MKSRKLMFVVAVALYAALVLPGQSSGQPSTPVVNGQIAFIRQINPEGGGEILIANPDGSDEQHVPLGDGAEVFSSVVWSPESSKLLISHTLRFDSDGQCCLLFRPAIVSPDGSGYTLLMIPNGPSDMDCLAWSADGTRLLCAFGDQNAGVFSIRASDGGDPVRLTTNPYSANGGFDAPADVSPDGRRFIFLRFKTKPNRNDPTPDGQAALFVQNLDGTGLRQLTASGLVRFGLPAAAHWSPNGTRIIGEMGNGKMFTIRPDGTGFTAIDLQVAGRYFAFAPGWSPDGTRIIFCMFISGEEHIYSANPDGSDVVQITNATNFENSPDWGTHPVTP